MATRAAIYTRISKDREGNELGVTRQEDLCRELADRRGLEVVHVYSDNDISASMRSSKPRPSFKEMFAAARRDEFDVIVAYSNSRLTRQVREYLDIIELVKETGLQIKTVASGELDLSTADGQAVATTIAAWDQAESERTSERIKAAKAQRAANGQWHGGTAPYGYRASNARLVPNPNEVKYVNEAVRRVLAGDTLASIVKDWNDRSVPTRHGKHWRQTNLRSILMNRSLLGETKIGIKGWEPIINSRDFDRLQRIFNDPARKATHSPGVKGGKYSMGGGLTVCGNSKENGEICGKRLITGKHHDYTSLKCTKVVNGPDACGRVTIGQDFLEEYVFEKVLAALEKNPRWGQRKVTPVGESEAQLRVAERKRDDLQAQLDRLVDAIADDIITKEQAASRSATIRAQLSEAQNEIGRLLGSTVIQDAAEDGFEWHSWTPMRRRNFLRQVIQRVEIDVYPQGFPRSISRRKEEPKSAYEERRRKHHWAVMDERVRIIAN
ncbi:DNA invertase Pin-like site-specific DNA recombinase [Leucobacter komagatae]|uniref:DNA invertase Pin-like site-specific DNA recombinase n=1 Tax=Leucobacter komagatae TaxID=55969 RepID=A0A542Y4I2_9MICO|nr:recombinase family protein [Leucobacter komagatae]TQL42983.1 DNA invertase Pin-like site-specific DNA recombinase [Leucobacter komagatae]